MKEETRLWVEESMKRLFKNEMKLMDGTPVLKGKDAREFLTRMSQVQINGLFRKRAALKVIVDEALLAKTDELEKEFEELESDIDREEKSKAGSLRP